MNSQKDSIARRWDEWLPPSPHREAITELVARGRASIVQPDDDDDDKAPVLICEDGGTMPLPLVRCDGDASIYSARRPPDDESDHHSTKYSDVCGTLDEFIDIVENRNSATADEPEHINELLDDIRYMMGRMYQRQRQYTQFADTVRRVLEDLQAVEIVNRSPADDALCEIERLLDADTTPSQQRLKELAERVRNVANAQEDRLREHKNAALKLFAAYRDIKGPRDWSNDGPPDEGED